MTKISWIPALLGVALSVVLPTVARAEIKSVGTHSDCKKLAGGNRAACTKCLNSGAGFFNKEPTTGKWVCGRTSDMTSNAERDRGEPPPPPLKAMPAQQKKYAKIAAGTFHIGTPRPEDGSYRSASEIDYDVTITRSFMMKTTEVTKAEWYFVMKKVPERFKAACMDCPVTHVAWLDAIAYLNELSKLEKLDACYVVKGKTVKWKGLDCTGYRLPTDAEWEYAARGGNKAPTHGAMDDIAWHGDNSDSKLHPVGGKTANAFGLHDMVGNVAELVWDTWEESATEEPKTDPVGSYGLEMTDRYLDRTQRGGSFTTTPSASSTVAHRMAGSDADMGGDTIGFRPVRTIKK